MAFHTKPDSNSLMMRVTSNSDSGWGANTAGTTINGIVDGTTVFSSTASATTITPATTFTNGIVVGTSLDLNGLEFILDADADSSLTADTDDQVDLKIGGNDRLKITAPTDLTLAAVGTHFKIDNDTAGKTIRLNVRTSTQTSSSNIGFQSKPAAGANTTGDVIGCEISPRFNDTFTGTNLIGAHIDAYLKGTTGNLSGDVRGAQIELVTDDAGTRTVTGDVVGLRFRAAFSGTISGDMVVIRVEKAEAQTNSNQWEYFLELTGDNGLIWSDDYTTEVTTIAGAIKVLVNNQARWIPLYSGAPVV